MSSGMSLPPFLATTALEEFWDTTKPIFFLGSWCRRYSRKAFWETLNGEVLPGPWQDTQELYKAFQYCTDVYERLLPVLGETLNVILRVNHGTRYWRIVLGPWLLLYLHAQYDRYVCLRYALDRVPKLTTTVAASDNWITPADTLEFAQLLKGDHYNLQIYSQILAALGLVFPAQAVVISAPSSDTVKGNHVFTVQAKKGILKCLSAIEQSLKDGQSVIFRSSYFAPVVDMQLILKTFGKVWPVYAALPKLNALVKNTDRRSHLLSLPSNNEFERVLIRLLPQDLPLCFIEGFEMLQHAVETAYPQTCKATFSSVAWYFDEPYKLWAAASAERGNQLLGVQHGGNYGSLRYLPVEDHEINVTDRYYTWGWERPAFSAKVIPWPASKLSGRKTLPADNGKQGILFLATTLPRYLFHFPNTPSRYDEYLSWQPRFLASINERLLTELRVRFHREDLGWDIAQRWKDEYPQVSAESWDITFEKSLRNCRIYVADHLATTFLEALSADKPTILFWDPEINELRADAQPHYDRLRSAGILFDSPEAAAIALNAVYDDVASWWNEPERQEARRSFCRRFARTSAGSVDEWAKEFVRISKEGIGTL